MKKYAYLTIDDAPSGNFSEVCDYLKEMKIPAIFFCEGRKLVKRKNEVINAIKDGFIIGNHSYNHSNFSGISIEEARKEITETDIIIEELYKNAGVKRDYKLFRFPGLNNGCVTEYQ